MDTSTALMTAEEIASAVRDGRLSAVDVVRDHLSRVDAHNAELGALRRVRATEALSEAAAIDARSDRSDLPLAGVPIVVKDNIAVAGEQVRHGSRATDPEPAIADDELVRRLRDAGAVVLGISTMPELAAWAFTSSAADGVCRNPWNPDLDPGGSTGGGAVAVATGMAALALGTDGGGSLRIPAASCGLVGLKPGRDVVPVPGGADEHWCGLTSAGPITRTSGDAALALAVLADPKMPLPTERRRRIAVSMRCPLPTTRADRRQHLAIDRAVQRLRAAGHEVVEASVPYPRTLIQQWSRHWLIGVALDADLLEVDLSGLEPRTRQMVRKGQRLLRSGGPRPNVAAAWRARIEAWLSDYDALLLPTVARGPSAAGAFLGKRYLPTFLAAGRSIPFTQAWNLAALPAVSVPVGVHEAMPLSVQLAGTSGSEPDLLALARALEENATPPVKINRKDA